MEQTEIGSVRTNDPDTSHEAAEMLNVTEKEAIVEGYLRRFPQGLTAYEISENSGVALNTISPRFAPMQRKGILKDSGRRRVGYSNRKCIVWVLS